MLTNGTDESKWLLFTEDHWLPTDCSFSRSDVPSSEFSISLTRHGHWASRLAGGVGFIQAGPRAKVQEMLLNRNAFKPLQASHNVLGFDSAVDPPVLISEKGRQNTVWDNEHKWPHSLDPSTRSIGLCLELLSSQPDCFHLSLGHLEDTNWISPTLLLLPARWQLRGILVTTVLIAYCTWLLFVQQIQQVPLQLGFWNSHKAYMWRLGPGVVLLGVEPLRDAPLWFFGHGVCSQRGCGAVVLSSLSVVPSLWAHASNQAVLPHYKSKATDHELYPPEALPFLSCLQDFVTVTVRVNWEGEMNLECGWHHPTGWDPRLNKKGRKVGMIVHPSRSRLYPSTLEAKTEYCEFKATLDNKVSPRTA